MTTTALLFLSLAAAPDDAALLKQLADPSYAVREAASAALQKRAAASIDAIDAIAAGAGSKDAERATRAMAILEHAAFAHPIENEADGERADASERAISKLTGSQQPHVALAARAALRRHVDERHSRAVAAIRQLGGKVSYDPVGMFPAQRRGLIPGAGGGGIAAPMARPTNASQDQIKLVRLGADWTGGNEGLRHVARLEYAPAFKLRIEGPPAGVEPLEVRKLEGILSAVTVEFKSTAALSISSLPSTPLRVGNALPGGACARAGIISGDIIRSLDGREINSIEHVSIMLHEYRPGQTVPVEVERDGRKFTTDVTLDDWTTNDNSGLGR